MKKSKIFIFIAVVLTSLGYSGCTNLDEEVYDKLPVDQFGKNTKEVNSLIAPIYRTLKGVYPANFFYLSECSGDMAITPTRKGVTGGTVASLRNCACINGRPGTTR